MDVAPGPARPSLARRLVKPTVMVVMAGLLLSGLRRMLGTFDYDQVVTGLRAVSIPAIAAAIGLLAAQHALFIVREGLAVRFAGQDLPVRRIAIASLIARSLSTLGLATITGFALRLRIYEAWGLTRRDVTTLTLYNESTYYVGIASTLAAVFLFAEVPPVVGLGFSLPPSWIVGGIAGGLVAVYVALSLRRDRPFKIRSYELPVVRGPLLAGQVILPIIDIFLGAAIVWVVLPDAAGLTLLETAAASLLGGLVGSLTQVPGGLGVFETVVLQFVPASAHPATLAALLVRRVIVMLLPIAIGAVLLVGFELARRPHQPHEPAPWQRDLAATATAVMAFAAGVLLMLAASVPSTETPIQSLGPLAHTLAFGLGVGMLLVARGLHLRHARAWRAAVALFGARAVLALASGPDLPALGVAVVMLILLSGSRTACRDAEAKRDDDPAWVAAFVVAIAGVGWIALIADPGDVGRAALARAGGVITAIAVVAAAAVTRAKLRR